MPKIHLTTFIQAPAERVFDLCRHIDLHKQSMAKYKEVTVAGIQFGMIEKDDTVTWKARHLFKKRFLRVKVSEMKKHEMFTDEQVQGDFKIMKHEHYFKPCDNGTLLIDLFHFESKFGILENGLTAFFLPVI